MIKYSILIISLFFLSACGNKELQDENGGIEPGGKVCTLMGCLGSMITMETATQSNFPSGNYEIRWSRDSDFGICNVSVTPTGSTLSGQCDPVTKSSTGRNQPPSAFMFMMSSDNETSLIRLQVRKEGSVIVDQEITPLFFDKYATRVSLSSFQ